MQKRLQPSQHDRKGQKTTKSGKWKQQRKLWFPDSPLFFMCDYHVNLHASAVRLRCPHRAICLCHWGILASPVKIETSAMRHCHRRHGASAPKCSQIFRSSTPSDVKAFDKRQSGCIAMLHRLRLICRLCCLFWWAWLEIYIKRILYKRPHDTGSVFNTS